MIAATHSRPVVAFFNAYAKWKLRRHFSEVLANPPALDTSKSLLVIANHSSWWDGFTFLWVNIRHWRRKYFILMLEDELAKRPLFAKAGAFGIQPGTRDVVNTLRYAAEVLSHPENVMVIFPQGRIESVHTETLTFQQGVERIVADSNRVQILFAVCLPDFGTAKPKPALRFFFEPYPADGFEHKAAAAQFNTFHQRCKGALVRETEVRHGR